MNWLRKEDERLVAGRGYFVSDVVAPGQLHLAFLRSPYPHAHYNFSSGFDHAAKASAGVVAVLTHQTLGSLKYPSVNPLIANAHPPTYQIFDSIARYVGDPIAIVIAQTEAQARHAVDLLEIEWKPINTNEPSFERAVYDYQIESNVRDKEQTDVKRFADSDVKTEDFVSVSINHQQCRLSAAPMEPRAAAANWFDGMLQVWLPTQTPSRARIDLASLLNCSVDTIRVVAPDVGGAFGARASIYVEDILVAATARHLKAAVKWVGTRSEEFLAAMQGRGGDLRLTMQLDQQGQIQRINSTLKFDLGAWCPFSAYASGRNAARILPGPYRVPQVSVRAQAFLSHAAPVNIYRGAGRPEATLLMERAIEAAARQLNIDPLQLRKRNIVPIADFPFVLPSGARIDSANLALCLERAEVLFDYASERKKLLEQRRPTIDSMPPAVFGIGAALYVEPCGEGWESARLTLTEQGQLIVHSGSSAQGQGRETAYGQIVAKALTAPNWFVSEQMVTVIHGDTATCPEGIGALASRGTAIGGSAVLAACEQLKLAMLSNTLRPLSVDVKYVADGEAWASGCVIAKIKINTQTGELSIEKLVWVDDAGNVVNPMLVKGQMMGGLAQGLGQALMERLSYDEWGQLVTGSFMDYAMPRASDIPAVILESICTPSPMNKLGAKGVGEAGCIGVPAALLNAAIDALVPLGIDSIDFPLSSARIWSAIHEKIDR